MEKKLRGCKVVLIPTILLIFASFSHAADFPTRPIELVHSFGLGTPVTISMKVVADAMSKYLGQPIYIISVPGGGGIVGAYRVARAKPDGYTLYITNAPANGIPFYIRKEVPYKNSDFEFLAGIFNQIWGLVVKPNSPFKTVDDFVNYAKKNPSTIKLATYGVGTVPYLSLELLKIEAGGLKIDMVPYKTVPEMTTAILGGHVDAIFHPGGAGGKGDEFKHVLEAGARILAITSKQRLKTYPDVPTFAEKGLNVVLSSFYGIGGPKGMPKEVSQKLKDSIDKTMKDPQVIKAIHEIGAINIEFRGSEEFTVFLEEYEKTIKKIVEEAKIPKE